MYDFAVRRPSSVQEAVQLLANAEDGIAIAGGHTLVPTLKQRLASPSDLVDLSGVADMAGIREEGGALVIGAMTTHAAVANDATVKARIPALAHLAEGIGDAQVRHRGTIGGSIANADPAADYPAAVLGLGATVNTDRRSIAADDFFTGLFETALEDGELIVSVSFPVPDKAGYAKFANPASRYAVVGVFVSQGGDATRVAVTGAGPSAFRVPEMEQALANGGDVGAVSVSAEDLNSDLHATADYRAHLVSVMAKRAVAAMG